MNNLRRRIAITSIPWALVAVGCSSAPPSEDTASVGEQIVNGYALGQWAVNYYGLVAIYHPDPSNPGAFFPRPCSGRILRSAWGYSTVLTARHCVTTDGSYLGPPVDASSLRLIPTANPGPANPNPPAQAVTPNYLVPMPPVSITAHGFDLAVIYVVADWSSHVAGRLGLWLAGAQGSYPAVDYSMGYGINVADWNCQDDRSIVGAGTARWGGNFLRTYYEENPTDGAWYYALGQPNGTQQAVNCGDSGGPDFVDFSFNDDTYMIQQVGVHSWANGYAERSAGMSMWLQEELGGNYLSPAGGDGYAKGLSREWGGYTVSLVSNWNASTWYYSMGTKEIRYPYQDWCLDVDRWNTVVANPCNGAWAQKWYPDAGMRIHNGSASGLCLTSTGSGAVVGTCTDSPLTQAWIFHPQP